MHYAAQKCEWIDKGDHFLVRGKCVELGHDVEVKVSKKGVIAYTKGELIQDAFPELNSYEREFLLSGYSKEAWERIFG